MGRTACTEPQCLYKGALYLYLRVELYLYSPYGSYGLYRASVPVQGCTLPLPNSRAIPLLPLWVVRPVQSLSACTRVHFTFYLSEIQNVRDICVNYEHFFLRWSFLAFWRTVYLIRLRHLHSYFHIYLPSRFKLILHNKIKQFKTRPQNLTVVLLSCNSHCYISHSWPLSRTTARLKDFKYACTFYTVHAIPSVT